MNQPILAYVETSLPAASQTERLEAIRRWEVALEIANQGAISVEVYRQSQILIAAVQAYQMHEFHPLHHDPDYRHQGIRHVENTLELAARLNAPRVVTVCGFGHDQVDDPLARSVDFFAALTSKAKALGIRILIEPLSPRRAGAMTDPNDIVQLLECLNEPTVFSLLLDTGHLLDSGFNLTTFFSTWTYPIEELQLKGIHSAPPDPTMPIAHWLATMTVPPQVLCVEHRQPISWKEFDQIISNLRAL